MKLETIFTAARPAFLFVAALVPSMAASALVPLGTQFSYQGQLKLGGVPLNDTAEFEFTLWDAEVDGNMIGEVVVVDDVDVIDGDERFLVCERKGLGGGHADQQ